MMDCKEVAWDLEGHFQKFTVGIRRPDFRQLAEWMWWLAYGGCFMALWKVQKQNPEAVD